MLLPSADARSWAGGRRPTHVARGFGRCGAVRLRKGRFVILLVFSKQTGKCRMHTILNSYHSIEIFTVIT